MTYTYTYFTNDSETTDFYAVMSDVQATTTNCPFSWSCPPSWDYSKVTQTADSTISALSYLLYTTNATIEDIENRFSLQPSISPTQPKRDIYGPYSKSVELARSLLMQYLDEDNKKRYINKESIEIPSKLFDDVIYKIRINRNSKILAFEGDHLVDALCVHVEEHEKMPLEDVILTKILYILYNEENLLRSANHDHSIGDLSKKIEMLN